MASEHKNSVGQSRLLDTPASAEQTRGRRQTKTFLFVLILSLCAFLPALGSFGFIDPSDGLYPEGAREMLETHNYLIPCVNYQPFYEKPILIYWLIAGCFKIFGICEFSARLPSAVCSIGCCLLIFSVSRAKVGFRAAFLAALILLSNLLFITIGHLALTDAPLNFFCTTSFLGLFLYIRQKRTVMLLLAYSSLALSFLLKGPVILLLAALTLMAYKWLLNWTVPGEKQTSFCDFGFSLQPLLALLVLLLICLPWFVAIHCATDGAFTQEFFIQQNLGRAIGHVNHREQFWFYIPYLAASFLPWLAVTPYLIPHWRRLFKRRVRMTERTSFLLFAYAWLVVTAAVFFAVPTKLPSYILPMIPPASILIGAALDERLRIRSKAKALYANLGGSALVVGVVLAVFLFFYRRSLEECSPLVGIGGAAGALVMLLAGSLFIYFSKRGMVSWLETRAVSLGICCSVLLATPAALMSFYNLKDRGLKDVVEAAGDANLATLWRDTTAGVFYHRKRVQLVMTVEDMSKYLASSPKPHMIVCTKDLLPFLLLESKRPRLHLVKDGGHFGLYNLD